MDLKVHCPGCRAILMVPVEAAGRIARCPACDTKFQIPTEDEIAEQTVSAWLEQDLEELSETVDDQWARRLREEQERRVRESQERKDETADEIEKVLTGGEAKVEPEKPKSKGRRIGEMLRLPPSASPVPGTTVGRTGAGRPVPASPPSGTDPGTVSATQPKMPVTTPAPITPSPVSQASPVSPVGSAPAAPPRPATPPAPATPLPPPMTPPAAMLQATEPLKPGAAPQLAAVYPSDLFPATSGPHLLVRNVSQKGIEFAFDSRYLQHARFRLSMPQACAFTNDRTLGNLMARPLAFTDRSQATVRNAFEIEAGHEFQLTDRTTGRDMLALMGVLNLPEPFGTPMPYYISQPQRSLSLRCTTQRREQDGGITCFVLIPDGRVALEWLRNVNGVCGEEFDLLARDVSRLWQSEWLLLDERVRQRLDSWVEFVPGERFRYYINDADMSKKDEGLAGIVLTDRRLIYHKYHRHGQVNYGEDASLSVRPDGRFAGLTVKTDEGTVKAAKFHFDDLEKLRDAARELGLKIDYSRE
ncbi:MAG: hypothetical protein IT440_09450 [Phycisphaeraceae bacterium]|nr:hypothetical protein [Phycisphaeraceae bacterium]